MKKQRPILAAVCGLKNSGKTSLIEKLLSGFAQRGYTVAVIKHDGHDFTCDVPGTDTARFAAAGAYGCAAFSKNRCFVHRQGTRESERELISLFPEADVILIEGLKDSALRKLELVRSAVNDRPVSNPEGRFLVVTDLAGGIPGERCVSFEETDRIIEAILDEEMQSREGKEMNGQLSHFDEKGQAVMVDVSAKAKTDRTAVARGRIRVGEKTLQAILSGNASKGDVLAVARIAGIMAVKKTSELIPLCHPLPLGKCQVDFEIDEKALEVESVCTVSLNGQTGVEMEALTGVSVSLLTIYDMCKAIDKRMEITGIHLVSKSGGKSGDFVYESDLRKGPSHD